MGPSFPRKYATATHIYLPLVKRGVVDFAVGADWTPATGDVKVSIDGGTTANIGTLPTAIAMGNTAYWDFTIATGETTGKKIVVTVADSATKAVEDQMFLIETYGNASAEYLVDFIDGIAFGLSALPNAIARGVVTTGATTTSIPTSSITPTTISTDQYKDRVVIFNITTTTTGLRGAASRITTSTTGGVLTVGILPATPASGDTFVIV